ncbi:MAG: hypothetical protein WA463_20665 [Terriglobales bacterium]
MSSGGSGNLTRALLCLCLLTLAAARVRSQTAPTERSFHASQATVESKLRDLGAYSGALLPILEGFVVSNEPSLDGYEQGYYQYAIQLKPGASGDTKVRVTAKITAWHAGSDPAHSG